MKGKIKTTQIDSNINKENASMNLTGNAQKNAAPNVQGGFAPNNRAPQALVGGQIPVRSIATSNYEAVKEIEPIVGIDQVRLTLQRPNGITIRINGSTDSVAYTVARLSQTSPISQVSEASPSVAPLTGTIGLGMESLVQGEKVVAGIESPKPKVLAPQGAAYDELSQPLLPGSVVTESIASGCAARAKLYGGSIAKSGPLQGGAVNQGVLVNAIGSTAAESLNNSPDLSKTAVLAEPQTETASVEAAITKPDGTIINLHGPIDNVVPVIGALGSQSSSQAPVYEYTADAPASRNRAGIVSVDGSNASVGDALPVEPPASKDLVVSTEENSGENGVSFSGAYECRTISGGTAPQNFLARVATFDKIVGFAPGAVKSTWGFGSDQVAGGLGATATDAGINMNGRVPQARAVEAGLPELAAPITDTGAGLGQSGIVQTTVTIQAGSKMATVTGDLYVVGQILREHLAAQNAQPTYTAFVPERVADAPASRNGAGIVSVDGSNASVRETPLVELPAFGYTDVVAHGIYDDFGAQSGTLQGRAGGQGVLTYAIGSTAAESLNNLPGHSNVVIRKSDGTIVNMCGSTGNVGRIIEVIGSQPSATFVGFALNGKIKDVNTSTQQLVEEVPVNPEIKIQYGGLLQNKGEITDTASRPNP